MAKAKPVPWPDRLINWCRSYPIASAIVFVIGLVGGGWTVGHNLYQVIARNADIDARLKGFETALSGVDTRINNSVTDATKHSQEDINKRFATLEARFETDHRTSDYLNRMAAHSCKLDYDGMLRVYDDLLKDQKLDDITHTATDLIYSKVLWNCCIPNRQPRLTTTELDRIAKGIDRKNCEGDNLYFLGVGYLGQRQTTEARKFLKKVYSDPIPVTRSGSPVPIPTESKDGIVFADSGVVAMLLLCDILDNQSNMTDAEARKEAAVATLHQLPSLKKAVEVRVVLRRLDVLSQDEFVKHALETDSRVLVRAFNDLRTYLRDLNDTALVVQGPKDGQGAIHVSAQILRNKGVTTSAKFSIDCEDDKSDPAAASSAKTWSEWIWQVFGSRPQNRIGTPDSP